MRLTIVLVIFSLVVLYISSIPEHPTWINAGDFLNNNAAK